MELKPGGLALVVRSQGMPNNLGRVVTTECLIPPDGYCNTPDGPMHNWTKSPVWYATGDVTVVFFSGRVSHGYAMFRPECLLPLNGDPDESTIEHSRGLVVV